MYIHISTNAISLVCIRLLKPKLLLLLLLYETGGRVYNIVDKLIEINSEFVFSMQKHATKGGYGWLIHTYLAVLITKLNFHEKVHVSEVAILK